MKRLFLLLLLLASSARAQLSPASSSSGSISTNASTCVTTNACVTLHMATSNIGYSATISGTWTGTLTVEQSGDNQGSWTSATTTTSNTLYTSALTPGITDVRVRGSAAMTGAAVVTITASGPAVLQQITQTGAGGVSANQYPLSRPYLRNTQAQLARLGQGVSNNVLTIIFGPGDSWMSNQFWTKPFSQWMWAQWQMSGSGYLSIAGANIPTYTGPQVPGCTVTPTGTWVYTNATSSNFGPDLTDSVSSDIATPATQTLTCAGSNTGATIYWLQQPSGGSFTWAVDGGGATTISTAGTLALGTTVISGLSQTIPHTIVLTVTVAGSGVDIFGLDWQNSLQPGVHIINLGDPGTRASTWNGANQTIFQAEIASLNPNLFITEFGGNELSGDVAPTTFTTNLNQVVTNMRAAAPNADCLMQSQSDVSIPGHLYTMDQYADAMQTAASASGCAFINTFINFPSYTVGNSLGLYSSASHLGQSGGEDMARLTKATITGGIQYSTFSQGSIGQNNLFVGPNAGTVANTGFGTGSYLNSGYSNTVMGINAGTALTTGYQNTLFGYSAGKAAATSCCNALFGYQAGTALTAASAKNTFIGWGAGQLATTAVDNVGVGYNVFSALTTGANSNVAVGESACNAVATVNANTCIGHQALVSTTGAFNTALGYQAGNANTSGTLNSYLGFQSGKTGVNNATYSTCIGADCVAGASNTITFGRANETTIHPGPASFANQITSTLSTGTAPLVIASTTPVANLTLSSPSQAPANVGLLSGAWNCVNVTPVTTAGGAVTTDQNTLACTIPANTLNLVGKTLSIRYKGLYTTNAANLSTINLKVKICSISGCASGNVLTLANITSAANAGGVTNFAMGYVGDATTQTAGAALAEESHGLYTLDIAATSVLPETVYSDTNTATLTGSPSSINSTAQNFLQVSCAFSVADALNTCQGRQLVVESIQ